MTVNVAEYKSAIGLDSLYIAEVTQDDATGYVADTPIYFAPAAEASAEPSTSQNTQYADDGPYDVIVGEGETAITLTVTGIPSEVLAAITGNSFDTVSGRIFDEGGTPPEYALGFRSKKSNGSYRYFWYMKGRFSVPSESFTTKNDSPEPQPVQITFTAVRTIYQFDVGDHNATVKRVFGDTDTTNFSATGWFTQVQTPSAVSPSALALSSSVPTDGATDISISANQTLTYNNALTADAIYNISLVKVSDYSVVSATISLDTTAKIVTINPASNLTNSAEYLIVANVTDIYGQHLNSVVNFTTVAA
jgi:phi13 family phage major tail protein